MAGSLRSRIASGMSAIALTTILFTGLLTPQPAAAAVTLNVSQTQETGTGYFNQYSGPGWDTGANDLDNIVRTNDSVRYSMAISNPSTQMAPSPTSPSTSRSRKASRSARSQATAARRPHW